jgi:hypothetical protein
MAHFTEWMPGARVEQLSMCKNWLEILAVKAAVWGVPAPEVAALTVLHAAAAKNLAAVSFTGDRTMVATAECRVAFAALKAKMRFCKIHYFLMPPLTESDFAALGLRLRDPNRTVKRTPLNQPGLRITMRGLHMLGFRVYLAAVVDPNEPVCGVRVYHVLAPSNAGAGVRGGGIVSAAAAVRLSDTCHVLSSPPLSPADLIDSFFTGRTRDHLNLPTDSSGLTCYLAPRYENSQGAGPWGVMVSAVVP